MQIMQGSIAKPPWAGPNGRGLQSQPGGVPGASGPRPNRPTFGQISLQGDI